MIRSNEKKKHIPYSIRFPIAGASGMGASLIVHPMDLIKFRMQLSGEGGKAKDHKTWMHAVHSVVRKEGVLGLYAGISANLLHQAIYTTTRMGIYYAILDYLKQSGKEGLIFQLPVASLGGMIAGIIGTPVEITLVRMTVDGGAEPAERRNYKHVFDAVRRIAKEEEKMGLFTGVEPAIIRSVIGNIAQLVSYTQTKEHLLANNYMEDNVACHFASSLVAGFVFAFSVCPIDVIKTRIQYMKKESEMYSGILDAMKKTVHKEGFSALWKGFIPLYARSGPHSIVLFIISEELTHLYEHNFV